MTYYGFVQALAERAGVSPRQARQIADAMIDTITCAVEEEGWVKLRLLGKLWREEKEIKGEVRTRIRFSSTRALRTRLKNKTRKAAMEKYGVKLDQDKVKEARVTGKCPDCGEELPRGVNSLMETKISVKCNNCGFKPFEEKP